MLQVMESNYWKPTLPSKHIHKDLDTGRATYTYNTCDGKLRYGELRWTAPTLIRLVPPSEKEEMQIMKLLRPVKSRGGPIREPVVCVWATHRDKLFRLGGDYSHILNFTKPYDADPIELKRGANETIEE